MELDIQSVTECVWTSPFSRRGDTAVLVCVFCSVARETNFAIRVESRLTNDAGHIPRLKAIAHSEIRLKRNTESA